MKSTKIFVFGSNTEGRHGAGAALNARQQWGAIYGQSKGLQGRSYAIITKDLSKGYRSVSLESIQDQVNELWEFVRNNQDKEFFVSAIGCGLAGFKIEEIAPMFYTFLDFKNVELNEDFKNYLNDYKVS